MRNGKHHVMDKWTASGQTVDLQDTTAWRTLQTLAQDFLPASHATLPAFDLREAFATDKARARHFSHTLHDAHGELLHADFSKAPINAAVMQALLHLAQTQKVTALRDAMFNGEAINTSEQRQVMHWLLRVAQPNGLPASLQKIWHEVDATRQAFLAFAQAVHDNAQITDIVNIGIGGSDLGPCMAVQALHGHGQAGKRFHFVSNVDGHELHKVLQQVQPQHTLFVVASKSFTTLETMTNARTALAWFASHKQAGALSIQDHFVGITANVQAAQSLGIHTTFGFWDWVGGRYSLWSAIGLPVAIAIGAQGFDELLAGARAVDEHFMHAPPESNLPVLLGLLQVWETSLLHYSSRCIAPYHADLHRLPAYLQQLEMESNGKSVDKQGRPVAYSTSPTVWGEPGSNGQHAFFQLLRQGTQTVPVEFIAVKTPRHPWPQHHTLLLANAVAQAQALMLGGDHADPQRRIAGNRPSTFVVLPELSPRTLGALLALYEHRVFVCGALWNINSFDQWGVELGKVLARDVVQRFASGDLRDLDASTADLLQRLRQAG